MRLLAPARARAVGKLTPSGEPLWPQSPNTVYLCEILTESKKLYGMAC